MKIKDLHDWDLSYAEAIALQKELAPRVEIVSVDTEPKIVAGLDCAFTKDGKRIIAAAIVMKLPSFDIIETKSACQKVQMPYIPGLLSFREAPACLEAIKKLENTPDLFLIDGQGIAHPRRLGLAAHIGLFINMPTIGCAKSRLIGEYDDPPAEKGSWSPLMDKDQLIGAVVRTRSNVKPLFISPGNKCQLVDAVELTLKCTSKYRLPEPTRQADKEVARLKLNA